MQRNDNLPTSDTNRTDRLILVIKCLDDVLVPSGDVWEHNANLILVFVLELASWENLS